MSRTEPAPLALLAAAADLIEQRAARTGSASAPKVAIYLDEAPTVLASPASDARGLAADLIRLGRNPAVYRQEQLQPRWQHPTLGGLTTAIERGEQ